MDKDAALLRQLSRFESEWDPQFSSVSKWTGRIHAAGNRTVYQIFCGLFVYRIITSRYEREKRGSIPLWPTNFMNAPKIRYVEPKSFDKETIEKILDSRGNWVGVIERRFMTHEELLKLYPDAKV